MAVDVLELSVRDLKEVLIARKKLFSRSYDVLSEVERVLLDSVLADYLFLTRIQVTECKRVECIFHDRVLEFQCKAILLYSFRLSCHCDYSCCVGVLYVFL